MGRAAYPRAARLRRRKEIQQVIQHGRTHRGLQCLVRILANEAGRPRLGIAAPRRFGKAVRRNRFRRLVREAFRQLQGDLGAVDVFVSPRRGLEEPTLKGLTGDLASAGRSAAPR